MNVRAFRNRLASMTASAMHIWRLVSATSHGETPKEPFNCSLVIHLSRLRGERPFGRARSTKLRVSGEGK